jgi:hypothetical protein
VPAEPWVEKGQDEEAIARLVESFRTACRTAVEVQRTLDEMRRNWERNPADVEDTGNYSRAVAGVAPRRIHALEVVRQSAAELVKLAPRDPARILDVFAMLLHDEDPAVRASASLALGDATRALGQPGNSAVVEPLLGAFREAIVDGDEKTSEKLRRALETIGSTGSPAIVDGLDDPTPLVRWSLVRLLAKVGEPNAIPRLTLMLDDHDEGVRDAAEYALERIRERHPSSV